MCSNTQLDSDKIISNHKPWEILNFVYMYQLIILIYIFCNVWLFFRGWLHKNPSSVKILSVVMEDLLSSAIMRRFASIYQYAVSKHVYFNYVINYHLGTVIHLIHSFAVYIELTKQQTFRWRENTLMKILIYIYK